MHAHFFHNTSNLQLHVTILMILQPEETMFEPFRQYCEMYGLSLMIVPKGFDLSPPQINSNDDEKADDMGIIELDGNTLENEGTTTDDTDLDAWG